MGKKTEEIHSIISRRSFLIGALQGGAVIALGGRLAWLQLAQSQKYKTMADKNRIHNTLIAPERGDIVDRYGVPLSVNLQNFRVLLIPEDVEDVKNALTKLSALISLSDEDIDKAIDLSKKIASFVPIEVIDNLSWKQVSTLEVNIIDLPGLSIDEGSIRHYPLKEVAAHLTGYVALPSAEDIKKHRNLLKLPGFRIGKTGLEKAYNPSLQGKEGHVDNEVNVSGRTVQALREYPPTDGERLSLSIDAELQRLTYERLSAHESASAIVMDAHTGALYACASYPSYDPNLFIRGIPQTLWDEYLADPAFPLTNKAVAGQYPPGSTFKMITALAILEKGLATANTKINCRGRYEYGKDVFHCWKLSGHGNVTLSQALMKSCDTYFYELSTEVGIEKIAAMAYRFGLGRSYDFDLREEKSGLIPTPDWKRGRFGQEWRPGETVIASIGQGYILSTPLQLAVMTSRLVNGGFAVKPWLVGYQGEHKLYPDQWPSMNIDPSHLALVKKGMNDVVNHKDGTAYGARIDGEDMAFGGKTGTAQVKKIDRAQRAQGIMNEDLKWKYRHHALFVGYAPVHNPRYVCSVVIEHGGSGSAVAAPVARDILEAVQKRNPAKKMMKVS